MKKNSVPKTFLHHVVMTLITSDNGPKLPYVYSDFAVVDYHICNFYGTVDEIYRECEKRCKELKVLGSTLQIDPIILTKLKAVIQKECKKANVEEGEPFDMGFFCGVGMVLVDGYEFNNPNMPWQLIYCPTYISHQSDAGYAVSVVPMAASDKHKYETMPRDFNFMATFDVDIVIDGANNDEEIQQLEPTEVQRRLEETFGESAVEYEDADEESEGDYEDPTMVWTKFAEDQYADIQPTCSLDEKGEIFIDYSTKKAVC